MDPLLRALIIIVLALYIGWRVWSNWQGAGQYAEAQDEAMKAWKKSFQQFKSTPQFQELESYINSKYKTTFDKPMDSETYQIAYVTLMNDRGQSFLFEEIAQAKFLIAYLHGKQGKKQVSMNLDTKEKFDNDLGGMAYSSVVPYWAGN